MQLYSVSVMQVMCRLSGWLNLTSLLSNFHNSLQSRQVRFSLSLGLMWEIRAEIFVVRGPVLSCFIALQRQSWMDVFNSLQVVELVW